MGRYFEPFVGSGAVFFDLAVARAVERPRRGAERRQRRSRSRCYRRVGRSLDEVVAALDRLAADHAARGRDCYLQVRDQHFNPLRAAWRDRGAEARRLLRRARRDAHLPESHRIQRPVPLERVRRIQRAARDATTRRKSSIAPLLTQVSQVLSAPDIRIEHAAFDRSPARCAGRRLRLFRSAVRAAQRHRELPWLHRARIFRRRSGTPAAGRDRPCGARRAGPAEQLGRAVGEPVVRRQ